MFSTSEFVLPLRPPLPDTGADCRLPCVSPDSSIMLTKSVIAGPPDSMARYPKEGGSLTFAIQSPTMPP